MSDDRHTPTGGGSRPELDFDALRRCVPRVDQEMASAVFGRVRARRAARRRLRKGGLALGAVAVVGLVASAWPSGRSATTVASSDGVVESPAAGDGAVSAAGHGVVLSVDVPDDVVVGTRVEAIVHLRNTTDQTLVVGTGGGCTNPVSLELGPAGTTGEPAAPAAGTGTWNGDVRMLGDELRGQAEAVAGQGGGPTFRGRLLGSQAVRDPVCPLPLSGWPHRSPSPGDIDQPEEALYPYTFLEPGQQLDHVLVLDLRWGTGDTPAMTLTARTGPVGLPGQEPPDADRVVVQKPVAVRDDPARLESLGAALAPGGIPAAPALGDWVDRSGGVDGRPEASGRSAELSWWQGRWQATLGVGFGSPPDTGPLLIRWDPRRQQVTDVREVARTNVWADSTADTPGLSPDKVFYHLD